MLQIQATLKAPRVASKSSWFIGMPKYSVSYLFERRRRMRTWLWSIRTRRIDRKPIPEEGVKSVMASSIICVVSNSRRLVSALEELVK